MREKEPSNELADSEYSERRFTLPKSRILRGKRNFEELFNSSSFFATSNITLRYHIKSGRSFQMRVGFIAPKRIGKAVDRVRTKRILREAFRLNQHLIAIPEAENNASLLIAFIAKHAHVDFHSAQEDIIHLLNKLNGQISHFLNPDS